MNAMYYQIKKIYLFSIRYVLSIVQLSRCKELEINQSQTKMKGKCPINV